MTEPRQDCRHIWLANYPPDSPAYTVCVDCGADGPPPDAPPQAEGEPLPNLRQLEAEAWELQRERARIL